MLASDPSTWQWTPEEIEILRRKKFGRSPRPGKWKNIQALTEEDVKSFRREQSPVKVTG